ncbi:MAG: lytic transglycosylase domain-containing protein [Actinomycetes bacterium]
MSTVPAGAPAARHRQAAVVAWVVAVAFAVTIAVLVLGASTSAPAVVDPVARLVDVEAVAPPPRPPAPAPSGAPGPPPQPAPDPVWVADVAARTGIPARALVAYAEADLRAQAELPGCAVSWATLAGIGDVESRHGTIGGRALSDDGRPVSTPIIGVALSGAGPVAHVADSDAGRLDGDATYDRAVGPMQFIPQTWRRWGADGDGDGRSDPQDVDDATWSAARYLCASGGRLDSPDGWRRAVLSYNPSGSYVLDVLSATNAYAARSRP